MERDFGWSGDRRSGLGHRRLLDHRSFGLVLQPDVSQDGQFVVVFERRSAHYPQLRAELEADGACFARSSDTEVLRHLDAVKRAEMVDRLRGMFAFAIWTKRRGVLNGALILTALSRCRRRTMAGPFALPRRSSIARGRHVSREPNRRAWSVSSFGSVPSNRSYALPGYRSLPAGHSTWLTPRGRAYPCPFQSCGRSGESCSRASFDSRNWGTSSSRCARQCASALVG